MALALAIAVSKDNRITFTIKPEAAQVAPAEVPEVSAFAGATEDEEMVEEPTSRKGKKAGKGRAKGMPRKALKNLINAELEKQAREVFQALLKSDDLPKVDMTAEQAEVEHEGVECDGCGVNPIRGIRYKCSVRKNFDYCANCEERLGSEHAMLKITRAGGAPEVMVTMLGEDATEESKEGTGPEQVFAGMMNAFGSGRGCGRGGRGRGRGGRGAHGGNQMMRGMMQAMFEKMEQCKDWSTEDWQKKVADFGFSGDELKQKMENWGCKGKNWKEARAICKSKPEGVISMLPGTSQIIEIRVVNETYWPWKPGCTLTLADEQEDALDLPIEIFSVPIEAEVKGKAETTVQVPLSMKEYIVADPEKVYKIFLTFRGPRG